MRLKHLLLLLSLLAVSSSPWAAKKPADKAGHALNRSQVIDVLALMDKAVTARDVDGLMDQLAKDVKVQIATPTAQGMQPMNFGREEYRKLMADAFAGASAYQVKRQDVAITPSPEGRAVATDILFETIRMKDREIRTISNERLVFGREDGKLKLLGLTSTIISSNE
jgi:hypothetical protein